MHNYFKIFSHSRGWVEGHFYSAFKVVGSLLTKLDEKRLLVRNGVISSWLGKKPNNSRQGADGLACVLVWPDFGSFTTFKKKEICHPTTTKSCKYLWWVLLLGAWFIISAFLHLYLDIGFLGFIHSILMLNVLCYFPKCVEYNIHTIKSSEKIFLLEMFSFVNFYVLCPNHF